MSDVRQVFRHLFHLLHGIKLASIAMKKEKHHIESLSHYHIIYNTPLVLGR